jgi:hypothetical protein
MIQEKYPPNYITIFILISMRFKDKVCEHFFGVEIEKTVKDQLVQDVKKRKVLNLMIFGI